MLVNLVSWVLLFGLPLYGLRAGSGSLLFTSILIALFGILVQVLGTLFHGDAMVIGFCQLAIFSILSVAAFPLGALVNRFCVITFEPFDFVPGFMLGAVSALTVLHFLLVFALAAYAGTPMHAAMRETFAVRQFVYFEGWHHLSSSVLSLNSRRAPLVMPE